MNEEKIRSIAQIMGEQGLTLLTLTEGDTVLHMERMPQKSQAVQAFAPVELEALTAEALKTPVLEKTPEAAPTAPIAYETIVSPMVGIFYASASPESPPFVKIGQEIKAGDVVCMIEAMKLFNEITAEVEGTLLEQCVKNGEMVEFGQVLFKVAKE